MNDTQNVSAEDAERKRVYWRAWGKAFGLSLLVNIALTVGLSVGVGMLTGWKSGSGISGVGGGVSGGLSILTLFACNFYASRAVRLAGLSKEKHTIETFENAGQNAVLALHGRARFEVWQPTPKSHVAGSWCGIVFFALFSIGGVLVAHYNPTLGSQIVRFTVAPIFAALSGHCLYALLSLRATHAGFWCG